MREMIVGCVLTLMANQLSCPQTFLQLMMLGMISNEGDVMPQFFFEEGLRVNADSYIRVIDSVVKPWMEALLEIVIMCSSKMTHQPIMPTRPNSGWRRTWRSSRRRPFAHLAFLNAIHAIISCGAFANGKWINILTAKRNLWKRKLRRFWPICRRP